MPSSIPAGRRAEFRVKDDPAPGALEIIVSGQGPGITDLDAVPSGNQASEKEMGLGLRSAQRLMDAFHIDSAPSQRTRCALQNICGRARPQ
jgi:anti-sigma regulatory factor (Ser/Thr protein kinase)